MQALWSHAHTHSGSRPHTHTHTHSEVQMGGGPSCNITLSANMFLTWGSVGFHGGLHDQRAALGGHGHCHLALLVLGQGCLDSLCVDIWNTNTQDDVFRYPHDAKDCAPALYMATFDKLFEKE